MVKFFNKKEVLNDSPMLRYFRQAQGDQTYDDTAIQAAVSLNKLLPNGGDDKISPLIGCILRSGVTPGNLQDSFSATESIIVASQQGGQTKLEGSVQILMQLFDAKSIKVVEKVGQLCTLSPVSCDDLQILLNVAQERPEILAPIYEIQQAIKNCHQSQPLESRKSECGDIDNKYIQAVKSDVSALTSL